MSWFRKSEGMSPGELNDFLREAMAEIVRRSEMGPVEREIDQLIQYGWTLDDMRKAFRTLAKAIDAGNEKDRR